MGDEQMSIIAQISLAVIAASGVASAAALVSTLMQVHRTARRAEEVLADVAAVFPSLLTDVRTLAGKLDHAIIALGTLTASVERIDRLARRAERSVDEMADRGRDIASMGREAALWAVFASTTAADSALSGLRDRLRGEVRTAR